MTDFRKKGIVILNYNTFEDTVRCMDSVFRYEKPGEELRVYLVDNCSPDGSGELLSEKYDGIPFISVLSSGKNGGFSYGNNTGLRAALSDGCEVVFFLNSDVILRSSAVSLLSEQMSRKEDAAASGPAVFSADGKYIQFARKALTFRNHLLERLPFLNDRKVRCFSYDEKEDFVFTGMCSGCFFGLRADFIREQQLFDDRIFMYYEEDILAHLLEKAGKKTLISGTAEVVHNEASSTKRSVSGKASFEKMYRWTSALYVLRQYAGISPGEARFLYRVNRLLWKLLSLRKKEYKDRYEDFIRLLDGALQ